MSAGPYVTSSSYYVLNLDNQAALLKSFDGGAIRGEVETLDRGPQEVALKHIAALRYEPFTLSVGLSMGAPLASWIKAALDLAPERKTGVVVAANFDGKAQSYFHFTDTLIEEITVPAMDASNKEPAFFKIRCQPEAIRYDKGDNATLMVGDVRPKKWLSSNFRLRIGDLPCARVTKLDAFTIRQRIIESTMSQLHDGHTKGPAGLVFPNLKVTFSAADFGPWHDWFSEFVIRGRNDQGKELQGTLEFMDPSMAETLGSVEFSQIGIFSLMQEKPGASGEPSARYVADLYVESMAINLPGV